MIEYFKLAGGLLGLGGSSSTVQEIEDPANPGQVIYDQDSLNSELSKKYIEIFSSDL